MTPDSDLRICEHTHVYLYTYVLTHMNTYTQRTPHACNTKFKKLKSKKKNFLFERAGSEPASLLRKRRHGFSGQVTLSLSSLVALLSAGCQEQHPPPAPRENLSSDDMRENAVEAEGNNFPLASTSTMCVKSIEGSQRPRVYFIAHFK